ncbi:hypothetical protein BDQ12DRAFT_763613 [Crucibulum laeve]|uniref:Uncharacterized protein n=1 Tax=Crucibulum laeve TaxID=68775 RepID=A0A5C3LQS2_9AGAR|nr:hypothetical protein BDQ12DRAFT_763613 [Crucibulum laeve]
MKRTFLLLAFTISALPSCLALATGQETELVPLEPAIPGLKLIGREPTADLERRQSCPSGTGLCSTGMFAVTVDFTASSDPTTRSGAARMADSVADKTGNLPRIISGYTNVRFDSFQ